jgi:hypothetical protein
LVAGAPWDSTFAAAVVAGILALLGLVWGVIAFFITQAGTTRVSARKEWRERFDVALVWTLSTSKVRQKLGMEQISSLTTAKWVTKQDRDLAISAVAIVRDRYAGT